MPLSLHHTDDGIAARQMSQVTGGEAWRGRRPFGSGGIAARPQQGGHCAVGVVDNALSTVCAQAVARGDDRQNVVGGGLLRSNSQRVNRNLTTLITNHMVGAQQTNIIFQKLKEVGKK